MLRRGSVQQLFNGYYFDDTTPILGRIKIPNTNNVKITTSKKTKMEHIKLHIVPPPHVAKPSKGTKNNTTLEGGRINNESIIEKKLK